MIEAIAAAIGLPFGLLSAVIGVESGGANVISFHDGRSPSYGLGQMKMRTAQGVDPQFQASDLLRPERNARLSAMYLRQLHSRFGSWDRALCFYNSGKGRPSCTYSRKVRKMWAVEKIKESSNEAG